MISEHLGQEYVAGMERGEIESVKSTGGVMTEKSEVVVEEVCLELCPEGDVGDYKSQN